MDDQTFLDTREGERIMEAILKTNETRPPVNLQEGIVYAPVSPDFWRQVAQRLRLDKEGS